MSKFNIYKVDIDTSTTTNATPETIIASQIGEAIVGDFSMNNSFRAAIVGSPEDVFEAMQNKNQAIGSLEMDIKLFGEWITKFSKVNDYVMNAYGALINAQQSMAESLESISDLIEDDDNFEDLLDITEDTVCIPEFSMLSPLHDAFRGCLQTLYKFEYNK